MPGRSYSAVRLALERRILAMAGKDIPNNLRYLLEELEHVSEEDAQMLRTVAASLRWVPICAGRSGAFSRSPLRRDLPIRVVRSGARSFNPIGARAPFAERLVPAFKRIYPFTASRWTGFRFLFCFKLVDSLPIFWWVLDEIA